MREESRSGSGGSICSKKNTCAAPLRRSRATFKSHSPCWKGWPGCVAEGYKIAVGGGAKGGEERAGRDSPPPPPGCTLLAVVGAHLMGQPLNRQLTSRGARLVRTTKSAPGYRLYALPDTTPPKPGLVRVPGFDGPGIELEVWAIPTREFGSFVAATPAPLGIGSVELVDGSTVKGFVCEPFAISGAQEITAYGGWRAYLAAG